MSEVTRALGKIKHNKGGVGVPQDEWPWPLYSGFPETDKVGFKQKTPLREDWCATREWGLGRRGKSILKGGFGGPW